MRLWGCIPLTLLALVALSTTTQVAWNSDATIQSNTLVDVLNNDEDYSSLLSLLQKAKLIPTLNKLNGSTLFAPTNDAIKRHDLWRSALEYPTLLKDNVQEELRQQLFYHLLNFSVTEDPKDLTTLQVNTLHFPKLSLNPPTNEPPPWMPIPESSLGNQSQKLRLTSRDGVAWVGVDAFGKGGIEVKKQKVEAANGVVYGIAHVLEVPPDLGRVLSHEPSLSYFQKVLTPSILNVINSTSELTLFIPVDSAWEALDPIERLYLESQFAADDLLRILNMHAVVEKSVRWSDTFDSTTALTTEYGSKLEVVISDGKTTVSGATLLQPDIYASNGVLHLVSSLLVPPGALQLTPEKYLLALNCTSFISLIHSVNLTHLINDTETQYTILAPKDDVLSVYENDGLPKRGSDELKRVLQYHFLPGKWTPKKLADGMLLESVLREPGLDGGRQVMHVEVNDNEKQDAPSRHIKFGGAGITGEHIVINNVVVYFISSPLELPVDPLQTALPSLELSSFLAAVFSTSIADVIKKTPRATFLMPHNAAFKGLGKLVSDHLLAASSKTDLENVIMHHIIDGIEYSQSLVNGSVRSFATLEGSDLQLERLSDSSVIVSPSGGWAGMKSALYPTNMLTETGVIHELSDLMIPRSVELNAGKLMKAAKATTMINMVTKAGFDWVLNGTAPPEDSEWADQGSGGASWTLLCPTDDAFKKYNLTQILENIDILRALVSQHLIRTSPSTGESVSFNVFDVLNNNRPLPLEDLGEYPTLLSPSSAYGDIVFRALDDKVSQYMVGIKNARGTDKQADWARVLTWGRTTTGGGTGGAIIIDRVLLPYDPPWWMEYFVPSFVGVLGVGLISLFFYGVRVVWKRDVTEATYEPIGGFGQDDST
jgi:solute carrier family 25 carnitine/acylcarnitine transporter 20/29